MADINIGDVKGDQGTITIGTVTSGAPSSTPTVTNSGTPGQAVLDFSIVRGAKGDTGATGTAGTLTFIGTPTEYATMRTAGFAAGEIMIPTADFDILQTNGTRTIIGMTFVGGGTNGQFIRITNGIGTSDTHLLQLTNTSGQTPNLIHLAISTLFNTTLRQGGTNGVELNAFGDINSAFSSAQTAASIRDIWNGIGTTSSTASTFPGGSTPTATAFRKYTAAVNPGNTSQVILSANNIGAPPANFTVSNIFNTPGVSATLTPGTDDANFTFIEDRVYIRNAENNGWIEYTNLNGTNVTGGDI